MGLFSILGTMSPLHIWTATFFGGAKKVGRDAAGNSYYEMKPRRGYTRPRRIVLYRGTPEATKIPPEWHGWMHHQTNVVPTTATTNFRRPWQKPHQPNATGTAQAYLPQGHLLASGKRPKATGDYQAWTPDQD